METSKPVRHHAVSRWRIASHRFEWGPGSRRTFHESLPCGGASYCPYSGQTGSGEVGRGEGQQQRHGYSLIWCRKPMHAAGVNFVRWCRRLRLRRLSYTPLWTTHIHTHTNPHIFTEQLAALGSPPRLRPPYGPASWASGRLISVSITATTVLWTLSF